MSVTLQGRTRHDQRIEEGQVEEFYDREDGVYRSFWDSSGSLHWGYFEDLLRTDPADFLLACDRWTELLLAQSGIGPESHVLDVGCGNGNTSVYLAEQTGCRVTGVDLSGVRVESARARASVEGLATVEFHKGSAAELPFKDDTFTHVWSQATLYHVPDRDRALDELHRVLAPGGRLALDDLVTPTSSVTEAGLRSVYERLLFEPGPSHAEYEQTLRAKGFTVLEGTDLTAHLRKSYELLAERARPASPQHTAAYRQVTAAIDAGDVGWSPFVAVKVADPLEWVYDESDGVPLRQKYDAWSATYDEDLSAEEYGDCPSTTASQVAGLLSGRGAKVLDVGAGTGLCGVALAEQGFRDITAVDVSDGVLEKAARTGVYRTLVRHDIERSFPWEEGAFDVVVASGVFTFGHAGARALRHISGQLREGGLLAATFRDDYLASTPDIGQALGAPPLEALSRTGITIFGDTPMTVMVFRKVTEAAACHGKQ